MIFPAAKSLAAYSPGDRLNAGEQRPGQELCAGHGQGGQRQKDMECRSFLWLQDPQY